MRGKKPHILQSNNGLQGTKKSKMYDWEGKKEEKRPPQLVPKGQSQGFANWAEFYVKLHGGFVAIYISIIRGSMPY